MLQSDYIVNIKNQRMLKIYNTLTKTKEEFKPIYPGKVLFYHCGPTVYWIQHIGNMRGMMMADLIRRTLEYLGYEVKFVRNYTDVGHLTGDNLGDADTGEDRMEKASKREGLNPDTIAAKYIKIFEGDIKALNVKEPTAKPQATKYIDEMIKLVEVLLEKGYAYATPKAIYFDVSKKADYNKLNKQDISDKLKGAGTGDVQDPDKKHPVDFALWFFKTGVHQNALQTWPSPFTSPEVENGEGFPGWHIECSAMSMDLLGETLDIHMGGIEHISIHHTNEIAQSESATGKNFANYWLHNEHLTVDGGKMSKSLGNVYSVKEIIEKGYDPLALRYFFLQAQYRSKQNFTWEALDAAAKAYVKLQNHVRKWMQEKEGGSVLDSYNQLFIQKLEDDFNIPQALAVTWDLVAADERAADKLATVLQFDRVLGLKLAEIKNTELELSAEIKEVLAKRVEARTNKDWDLADKLRKQLQEEYGVIVEDTAEGQKVVNN